MDALTIPGAWNGDHGRRSPWRMVAIEASLAGISDASLHRA